MLPQTTLEMKAPSLLCAAAHSRIQFDNLYHISHVPVNGLPLLTLQKDSVIQHVPFFFYTRILQPILVQTLSLFVFLLFVTNQIKTTQFDKSLNEH